MESKKKLDSKNKKVAWLFPSLDRGAYWQPIFAKFTLQFPKTKIFTGVWNGFLSGYENSFNLVRLPKTKLLKLGKSKSGYDKVIVIPSFLILKELIKFKPDVVFASSFTVWTLFAVGLKFFYKFKLYVFWDGCSPNVDAKSSKIKTNFRKFLAKYVDKVISNSFGGVSFFLDFLNVKEEKIVHINYLLPIYSENEKAVINNNNTLKLLTVGRLIEGKGLDLLIDLLEKLEKEIDFQLQIVGDGPLKNVLKQLVIENDLDGKVSFVGWVNPGLLKNYYTNCDIFIFPSLEDIWGMVVLEAMAFGKPILCSKYAGVSEVVRKYNNGFVYDPLKYEKSKNEVLELMSNKSLRLEMGKRSLEFFKENNSNNVVKFLSKLIIA